MIKIFHKWQINRKVIGPVLDPGGSLCRFLHSSVVEYRFGKYANMLNYWLSEFVQERNWDRKGVRALYGVI